MTRNKDRWIAVAVLLPSVVLVGIFVYGFIGATFSTSLTDSTAVQQLSRVPANPIGFKNYTDLFSGPLDNRFRIDMTNTIFFTVMFIVICLTVGLLLAILLDQKVAGEGIFRTIFLFPMALSFVVTGTVWKWLFNPTSGINALPSLLGLQPGTFRWFTSQERVLEFNWQDLPSILAIIIAAIAAVVGLYFAVKRKSMAAAIGLGLAILVSALVFTGTTQTFNALVRPETHGFNLALIALLVAAGWQMSGYTMAMYLAGLRGVPEELREAARVDGCSEIAVYRRIVLPLLAPITLSAVIILGHISLKIFDLVYVMGGGDNLQIDMPGLNMFFETFRGQNFGRGAAIAMVMLVLVALVIVPYLYNSFKGEAKRS